MVPLARDDDSPPIPDGFTDGLWSNFPEPDSTAAQPRTQVVAAEHVSNLKPVDADNQNDAVIGRTRSIAVPLVIDDPSELPGVKAGSFSPNDPWLALQAGLKRQAGQEVPPC